MTHRSDAELVTYTLRGNATAFEALVKRYQQVVYGVCISLVHDFDLAQDLAQEAFLKAFQHLHCLARPTHFGTWLRVIAVNECRLYMRQVRSAQARRRAPCEAMEAQSAHLLPADQQWEVHQQRDARDRLAVAALQALERLSEKSRQAITLYYLGGQSLQEVGTFLGISSAAVKMRLYRARQQLQQEALTMVENALTQQQLGSEFVKRLQLVDSTILFADMAGVADLFTQLPAEEAIVLLYDCLDAMTQAIMDHGGTLHAYEGDAIVAFWGAPVPTADHAVQGCLAALALQARVAELNTRLHQDGKPAVSVKCGLQTGKLFLGEVALRQQQAATVWRTFGPAAELAFRLESANKSLGTSILVGHDTYAQAQGAIEARVVGQVKVRLYPTAVMAYEVLARKGELATHKTPVLARYMAGFTHYQARQWEQALPAFTEALQFDPTDGPSRFYKERCETLLAAPPEVIPL